MRRPPAGTAVENTLGINFASLIQATDFDHDTVPATGTFTVTVIDDIPVALANGVATVSGFGGRGRACRSASRLATARGTTAVVTGSVTGLFCLGRGCAADLRAVDEHVGHDESESVV